MIQTYIYIQHHYINNTLHLLVHQYLKFNVLLSLCTYTVAEMAPSSGLCLLLIPYRAKAKQNSTSKTGRPQQIKCFWYHKCYNVPTVPNTLLSPIRHFLFGFCWYFRNQNFFCIFPVRRVPLYSYI